MKNKHIKLIAALMAIMMFVGMMGCGSATKPAEDNKNGAVKTTDKGKDYEVNTSSLFPVVNKPITMSMVMLRAASSAENPNDLWFFKHYNKKTNVSWNITEIDSSIWKEKKPILLASGDYPDVFWGPTFSTAELSSYGKDGIFIPLNDLIKKYGDKMLNILNNVVPDAKTGIYAADGNIYSLPYFSPDVPNWYRIQNQSHEVINVDWLKRLGLKEPETLDEFYEVLLAFKNQDANGNGDQNDEIPWGGIFGQEYCTIMAAYGILGTDYMGLKFDTDKAMFTPLSDEYKAYVEFMNKCWKAGLIDKNYFTQKSSEALSKFSINGTTNIVGFSVGYDGTTLDKNRTFLQYDIKTPMVAKKGNKPITLRSPVYGLGTMEVTDKCKYPDVAVRWCNTFYDPEQAWYMANGPIYKSEDDPDSIGWIPENLKNTVRPVGFTEKNPQKYGIYEWYCRNIGPRNKGSNWTILYDQYARSVSFGGDVRFEGYTNDQLNSMYYLQNMRNDIKKGDYRKSGLPTLFFTIEDNKTVNELATPLNDYVRSMTAKFITGAEPLDKYDAFVNEMVKLGGEKIDKIYRDTYEKAKQNSSK